MSLRDVHAIINHAPVTITTIASTAAAEVQYGSFTRAAPQQAGYLYDLSYGYHKADMASFARLVDIKSGESVMDLGTGLGWLLQKIREHQRRLPGGAQPARFVGVDASQSMVSLAQTLAQRVSCRQLYGDFRFIHDNIITLQQVSGSFDIITCCWAFEHIPANQRAAALTRWKQLLTPGGRIVFDFQGSTPMLCAMDLEHPMLREPSRYFCLEATELRTLQQEYRQLTRAAGLVMEAGVGPKVLGINAHSEALGTQQDYATAGYEDHTEVLDGLCQIFETLAQRKPDLKEKQLLKQHYFTWALQQMRAEQPSYRGQTAMLRTKALSVVGVLKVQGGG